MARTNWAGNYKYTAERLHCPESLNEVQQVVRDCRKLKAIGSRHSFNEIADSDESQISLEHLNRMTLDADARTVTVGGGVTYGQLAPYLEERGYALHNLASLPHITIAGACATATHGSGTHNGNLGTSVSGMEIVTADGDVKVLSRERGGERFQGAVVSLGGLGVVTQLTIDVQPTFQVKQVLYEHLSMRELETHLDDIFGSGYSVSLFTDWQRHEIRQVWIKSRVEPSAPSTRMEAEFYGAELATENLHPLPGYSAENCTMQMGVAGPWHARLPHFRMEFTPSSGDELQSEYFVPRARGYEAILAVEELRDRIAPILYISELRMIDADDLWMSPCYKQASMALHFTWHPDWSAVTEVLPMLEEKLAPFDAKPHWAKVFTLAPAELRRLYVKMPEYKALLNQYDPQGKFLNHFLRKNLYGE